jgi:putative ABC transport system ATP-binding protein
MIVAKDVHKHYQLGVEEIKAVNGISLKVEQGEFIVIMGPSGSGKSTLLHLLGALDTPTKGEVLLDGINLKKLNDWELSMVRRKKIGYIFQSYNLIQTLNALENVTLPLIPDRTVSNDEKLKRGIKLLREVGLGDRILHRPDQLSGGERLRVAVARGLVNNPELIMADEPTGSLDSKTSEQIMNLMREMNRKEKKTFIIVTHNAGIVKDGDRILHIKDGKLEHEHRTRAEILKEKKSFLRKI